MEQENRVIREADGDPAQWRARVREGRAGGEVLSVALGYATLDGEAGRVAAVSLAVPVMVVGMAIGLLISIFQAMTQIQEQTLTFVPKIIAILVAILLLLPWSLEQMVDYTAKVVSKLIGA